jgi:hypothetical protein
MNIACVRISDYKNFSAVKIQKNFILYSIKYQITTLFNY